MATSPKRGRSTTRRLLTELANRPAMNGGWVKLARQQDEQCEEQRRARIRLRRVEHWITRWDGRWKWLVALLGTIATATVAKAVVEVFFSGR